MTDYQVPHIALTVNDIAETKSFYSKIGFSINEDTYSKEKMRHFLLLNGFGIEIEIFHFDDQPEEQQITENLSKVGLNHIALPVADLQKRKEELINKSVALSKDISISSLGVKNINIIDPSGFTLEFFEKS